MVIEPIKFSLPEKELSCFIGNLFAELSPPCDGISENGMTLQGVSFTGKKTVVVIKPQECFFYGSKQDYEEARGEKCLKSTCENGIR